MRSRRTASIPTSSSTGRTNESGPRDPRRICTCHLRERANSARRTSVDRGGPEDEVIARGRGTSPPTRAPRRRPPASSPTLRTSTGQRTTLVLVGAQARAGARIPLDPSKAVERPRAPRSATRCSAPRGVAAEAPDARVAPAWKSALANKRGAADARGRAHTPARQRGHVRVPQRRSRRGRAA